MRRKNVVVTTRRQEEIVRVVRQESLCAFDLNLYGTGTASEKIIQILLRSSTQGNPAEAQMTNCMTQERRDFS